MWHQLGFNFQKYNTVGQKIKKSPGKKKNSWNQLNPFFCEIVFLAVLNFFPVQKLIFGHFWNCKNGIWSKNEFFFCQDFLNFLAHCDS